MNPAPQLHRLLFSRFLFRERLSFGLRRKRHRCQADQENQAHGDAGVAHRLGIVYVDRAGGATRITCDCGGVARNGFSLHVVEHGHRGLPLGLADGDRGRAETHGGGSGFDAYRVVGLIGHSGRTLPRQKARDGR